MTRSEAKQLGIAHGLEVGKNADFTKEELADEDSFKEAALDAEMNARQYAGYTDRLEGRSNSAWEAYDEGVGIGIDRAWKRRQASAAFYQIDSVITSAHKSWNQRQREKIIAKADRKPMRRAGKVNIMQLPALYKLEYLIVRQAGGGVDVNHQPAFPVQIIPSHGSKINFRFWGMDTYDIYEAFPAFPSDPLGYVVKGIVYTIVISNRKPKFEHIFKCRVKLTLDGMASMHDIIMKPYGQLEGLPLLPNDYQYFQFIN